jgi:hypothetical protein
LWRFVGEKGVLSTKTPPSDGRCGCFFIFVKQ